MFAEIEKKTETKCEYQMIFFFTLKYYNKFKFKDTYKNKRKCEKTKTNKNGKST